MSRRPRSGQAAGQVTIRVTKEERAQWQLATSRSVHATLSASIVAVMNQWAAMALPQPKEASKVPLKGMKMWIGNLDGERMGLIIASSAKLAQQLIGTTRRDFNDYWALQSGVYDGLELHILYSKPMGSPPDHPWEQALLGLRNPGLSIR